MHQIKNHPPPPIFLLFMLNISQPNVSGQTETRSLWNIKWLFPIEIGINIEAMEVPHNLINLKDYVKS
jgi:hypothetical protein